MPNKNLIFIILGIALSLFPKNILGSASQNGNPVTGCYWEWMNGNISKEGITKDLEYMKAAGIESAFIFDAWVGVERGPVDYGGKEWIDAVRHACSEAKRLGIKLGLHNSPGYTAMGGPWIQPHESMKQLTWSVSSSPNPPVPEHKMVFYEDIVTIKTSSPDEMQNIDCRLEKGDSVIIRLQGEKEIIGFNLWRGDREKPLDPHDGPRDYAPKLKVEISKDGKEWKEVGTASGQALKARDIPIYFSCDAHRGSLMKLTSNRGTNLKRIEVLTSPGTGEAYRRIGYTTSGENVTAASEAGIGLEADKLSRIGVQSHFERFLRPLLEELKEYCGSTLLYICIDSWEAGTQDWSETMDAEYLLSGEGSDFLTGGIGKQKKTKQRLFMNEFLLPFRDMVHSYGLQLVGEPYGNGDFDRKEYGMAFDLPMSEYWARCHYGSIERPYFVSRYAHSAGRDIVGCESFTAYPGDAGIDPVLSNFKSDIDQLCDAGVNYFVFHCIAHQDCDSIPKTMGPFGTRFDRLHANVDSVRAITDYIKKSVEERKECVVFDYSESTPKDKAMHFRLPRGAREVKGLAICDMAFAREPISKNEDFYSLADRLGVGIVFTPVRAGENGIEGWDDYVRRLAEKTEHPEILHARIYNMKELLPDD